MIVGLAEHQGFLREAVDTFYWHVQGVTPPGHILCPFPELHCLPLAALADRKVQAYRVEVDLQLGDILVGDRRLVVVEEGVADVRAVARGWRALACLGRVVEVAQRCEDLATEARSLCLAETSKLQQVRRRWTSNVIHDDKGHVPMLTSIIDSGDSSRRIGSLQRIVGHDLTTQLSPVDAVAIFNTNLGGLWPRVKMGKE